MDPRRELLLSLLQKRRGDTSSRDIAIVGLAGRYPQAPTVEALWTLLAAGRSAVTEIPASRWRQHRYERGTPGSSGAIYSRWGAFLDDIDCFDPLLFRVSPREASAMDPQERLFLETVWCAIEDAGYTRSTLDEFGRVGVFAGAMNADYGAFGVDAFTAGGDAPAFSPLHAIANRVSYCFDFRGPSLAVDTACSSSLTAVHLACQSLHTGECAVAIAGGVNLILHPIHYARLCAMRMLTPRDRCRPFDEAADGMVAGEGVGAVILKPLARAVADRDRVWGVIKASTVNAGGKTSGYTVPNPNAQADLIAQAIERAGIDVRTIGYVEAHGTGTSLGDPLELAGLSQAFGRSTSERAFCGVGSIKGNIGHLESAAGIVSLTKVLLQLRHRQLAASIHIDRANPKIDFSRSPFFLQAQAAPWIAMSDGDRGTLPRRAAVSSFGAGGSNVHVIVEEAPAPAASAPLVTPDAHLIVLSAADRDQLRAVVAQTIDWVASESVRHRDAKSFMSSLAFTLQTSREPLAARLAVVATTAPDLCARLAAFLGDERSAAVCAGSTRDHEPLPVPDDPDTFLQRAAGTGELARLAEQWVAGRDIAWRAFYPGGHPAPLGLPHYPFARERFWPVETAGPGGVVNLRHPLLDTLVTEASLELGGLVYRKQLAPDEAVVRDHRVQGTPTLPAIAIVEMAAAAFLQATPGCACVEIADLVLRRPVIAEGQSALELTLTRGDRDVRFALRQNAAALPCAEGGLAAAPGVSERLPVAELRARCSRSSSGDAAYERFRAAGIEYGPSFRGIEELRIGDGETFAELACAPSPDYDAGRYVLPIGLLDAALQAAAPLVAGGADGSGLRVPVGVRRITVSAGPLARAVVHVRTVADGVDVTVADRDGVVRAVFEGVTFRAVSPPARLEIRRPSWTPYEVTASATTIDGAVVVIASPDDGDLAHDLAAAGSRVSRRFVAVDGRGSDECVASLTEAIADGDVADLIVLASATGAADTTGLAASEERDARTMLQVVQTLLRHGYGSRSLRLKVVTRNLHTDSCPAPARFGGAAASALALSAAMEAPLWRVATIDIDDEAASRVRTRTAAIVAAPLVAARTELAIRGGEVLALSLTEATPAANGEPWIGGRAYLIVGGTGGIGFAITAHAVRLGARVGWIGRRAATDAHVQRQVEAIRQRGGAVVYAQAEAADPRALADAVASIQASLGPLAGVVHAAGIATSQKVADLSAAELDAAMAAKVRGLASLHDAVAGEALAFFVVCSSAASFTCAAGQAAYAAANRAGDALASRFRARAGFPIAVINWGYWGDVGMAAGDHMAQRMLALGVAPMSTDEALDVFARIVGDTSLTQVVAAKLLGATRQSTVQPSAHLAVATSRPSSASSELSVSRRSQVNRGAGPDVYHDRVASYVRERLGVVLRLEPSRIDRTAGFDQYGVDSLAVAEFSALIERDLGPVPATLLFEHSTVDTLAAHLLAARGDELERLLGPRSEPKAKEPPPQSAVSSGADPRAGHDADEAIAIIGVSGRYPGANDLDTFWENLRAGRSAIREIPADRWRWRDYADVAEGAVYSRWGGFIDDVDKFDAALFRISPKEAARMDPQERLFLEATWALFEDAAVTRADVQARDHRVGVFIGVMNTHYELFATSAAGDGADALSSHWSIANRVSFCFDLQGPSLAVDTACSSSLTAVHLACESLRRRECRMAVAGGVNLILHPLHYQRLAAMKMIAADDRSKSFGQDADGFVDGEGVGAVLLKPLVDAIADGDRVYAVIRSSAVNAGGRTAGFTVPNPSAQAAVIDDALLRGRIDPRTLSYVEAHGTGTPLGDPIEVAGLTSAFRRHTDEKAFCALGSVKSNVGHLESAAGIVGLTKVLLMLRHGELVPTLHADPPNARIDFPQSPFYLQQRTSRWAPATGADGLPLPRRAAISSFGAGGANAHLILEEARPPADDRPDAERLLLFPLSAATDEALRELARLMAQRLDRATTGEPIRAVDVARTLQYGREQLPSRLVVLASSVAMLRDALTAFVAGERPPRSWTRSAEDASAPGMLQADDIDVLLDRWTAASQWERIAELWSHGFDLPWRRLGQADDGRVLSLPTYPFARVRHWVSTTAGLPGSARLHPLVARNVSTLDGVLLACELSADHVLIDQHRLRDVPTLPATACLEMMRVAAVEAGVAVTSLRGIEWRRPITGDAVADLHVRVSRDAGMALVEVGTWGNGRFDVYARAHAAIEARAAAPAPPSGPPPPAPGARSGDECYARFSEHGLTHGPALRALRSISATADRATATLAPGPLGGDEQFVLHPVVLDAALLSVAPMVELAGLAADLWVPLSIERLEWTRPLAEATTAVASLQEVAQPSPLEVHLTVTLTDARGEVVASVHGLCLRRVVSEAATPEPSLIRFSPAWEARAIGSSIANDSATSLLFCVDEASHAFREMAASAGALAVSGDADPAQVAALAGSNAAVHVVVPLWRELASDGIDSLESALATETMRIAAAVRALIGVRALSRIALVVCGRRATMTAHRLAVTEFGRAVALEDPRVSIRAVVMPDTATPAEAWACALRECADDSRASATVRYIDGRRELREWRESPAAVVSASALRDGGTYIITGGLGALGRVFASHLAETWHANVALISRSLPGEGEQRFLRGHAEGPGRIAHFRADVSQAAEIRNALQAVRDTFGAVAGIIHAAGIVRDGPLRTKDLATFADVIRPKIIGAHALDLASRHDPLDFFALCSSFVIAGGNPGQSDYAYANSYLDHFVDVRERQRANGERRGRTVAIAWPLWDGDGMQASPAAAERLRAAGVVPMRAATGIRVLADALSGGASHVLPIEGDGTQIRRYWSMRPAAGRAPAATAIAGPGRDLRQRVARVLVEAIAAETHTPIGQIRDGDTFDRYGVDSVMILTLTRRLEQTFGPLSRTLFFEHQTVAELTAHLMAQHAPALPAALPAAPVETPLPVASSARDAGATEEPIAIVGLAGRYPDADDVDALWSNIRDARDSVREIPADRWDAAAFFGADPKTPGRPRSRWGGFLTDATRFDAAFFGVTPIEAEVVDPQERLFLETVWQTLESAGHTRRSLSASTVGVFVGVMYSDYQMMAGGFADRSGIVPGSSPASIANRVSYFFDFHGPSLAVDSMCSSSLTAIHLACESIKRGECDAAVAGGVNLSLHPHKYLLLDQGRFLSSDGRCRAFGEGGDGYVPGEGVGVVLLKRLADAEASGDRILGVIRASAVNHGGKTHGYTVPNPKAQAQVIGRALGRSGWPAESLGYLEAHGTGTSLGDPIEIAALTAVLGGPRPLPVPIGSVKSNIGHLESAAGIAGVTKVLLQLEHGMLASTLHADPPNPHIDFANSPVAVQRRLEPWPRRQSAEGVAYPRRAGVSSFGAGGTNAHVLIEEYVSRPAGSPGGAQDSHLVVLSARTAEQLRARVTALLALARAAVTDDTSTSLRDAAYTLQVGRESMRHRLAVVVRDWPALVTVLSDWLERGAARGVYAGAVVSRPSSEPADVEGVDADDLARAWVDGAEVDWARRPAPPLARRVKLPPYPFAATTYGIALTRPSIALTSVAAAPPLSSTAPADDRDDALQRVVQAIHEVSKLEPHEIDVDAEFAAFGFDSIIGTRLIAALEAEPGELPQTLFLECRTARELAAFLATHGATTPRPGSAERDSGAAAPVVAAPSSSTGEPMGAPPAPTVAETDDLAIVGIAGRYPGAATLDAFWHNLRAGAVSVREVPRDRWDADALFDADPQRAWDGRLYCKWGGFLDHVDRFDALFFAVPPIEAELANPEERLMLETVWAALENAAIRPSTLRGARVGVFAGMTTNTYGLRGITPTGVRHDAFIDAAQFRLTNRVSQFFDFKGPSLTVDTACSSALVALHLAASALRAHECEMAVVGGVNLYLHPSKYANLCRGRLLSTTGETPLFSAIGNGFLPGEGVGAFVIKRLADAQRAGDYVHGILKACVIGHQGRGGAAMAPAPDACAAIISEAIAQANIDPATLGTIELQALGSPVTDLAEWRGLNLALRTRVHARGAIAIGSLKPNIGHLEAASGMAQLTKVLLEMAHGELAPVTVADSCHREIDLHDSPFFVPRSATAWPTTAAPRRAAISSFGAGGTHAHVIVEDGAAARRPAGDPESAQPLVVAVSNQTEGGLRRQLARLRAALIGSDVSVADLALTLATGRDAFKHRFAAVVQSTPQLLAAIATVLDGGPSTAPVFIGSRVGGLTVGQDASRAMPAPLAARWVTGDDEALQGCEWPVNARRIPLPSYAFAERRCWLPGEAAASTTVAAVSADAAVAGYYDHMQGRVDQQPRGAGRYLTLAPLPKLLPGFSAVLAYADPARFAEANELAAACQRAMRRVLFHDARIAEARRVLDLGCGVGSDLIDLAAAHPQLRCDGHNISEAQLASARRAVEHERLGDRIRLAHRDSTQEPFAGEYDLVLAFEVLTHIDRKAEVLTNVAASLSVGGRLVIADVVATTVTDVRMPRLGQYTSNVVNLARLLANARLAVVWASDASHEIANFLRDDDFDGHLSEARRLDPALAAVEDVHRGWHRFGEAIGAGLFRYLLISAAPAPSDQAVETLARVNREILEGAPAYAQALAMVEQGDRLGAAAPSSDAVKRVGDRLRTVMCRELHLEHSELDLDASFADLGVNSLQALKVLEAINREFDTRLEVHDFFDHPTARALAQFVARVPQPSTVHAMPLPEVPSRPAEPVASAAVVTLEAPIAVIGMAGRFPGAENVDELWEVIRNGVDAVTEVPADRWDIARFYDPAASRDLKTRSKWGGFVRGVDEFDPLFFRISPAEAATMDPQQRLFLQESWHALEDAGYAGRAADGVRCGVFAGVLNGDYQDLVAAHARPSAQALLGNAASILASRIAYFLNLKGVTASIDTACSSSLVAVHLACQALRTGDADMMLAGGVTLYLTERPYILMSHAGMLSSTGRCRSFDESADGIAPAEGVGVVVLKRLADAVRDGDHVYGVIRGSGVNQDGRTNGITAPSAESQTALELDVYRRSGISPEAIGLVEAHGTGTPLGDPIEVAALTAAFRRHTPRVQYCALGSIKSNLGHTSAAAGVASLIKVLLALKHRELPPTIHCSRPNARIDFAATPFYVNTASREWAPADGRRIAAVSALGFSGTNAHMLIEEALEDVSPVAPASTPQVIVLSAQREGQLRAMAARLLDVVAARRDRTLALDDLAFTLQSGRLELPERLAVVASTFDELADALRAFAAHEPRPGQMWTGRAAPSDDASDAAGLADPGDPAAAAQRWVSGERIDWTVAHQGRRRRRVPLPGYVFAAHRCWVEHTPDRKEPAIEPAAAASAQGRVDDFFASVSWRHAPLAMSERADSQSPDDVVLVAYPIGCPQLFHAVRLHHPRATVIGVALGSTLRQLSALELEIDYRNAAAWGELFGSLRDRLPHLRSVYFLGGLDRHAAATDDADALRACWELGPLNLLRLCRALAAERRLSAAQQPLDVRIATSGVYAIVPEQPVAPHFAGLHGFAKCLAAEYPAVCVVSVDISLEGCDETDGDELAARLAPVVNESARLGTKTVVVRGPRRYEQGLTPIALPPGSGFVHGGVYVIVGGAGAIGLALAEYLARRYGASLVLMGRREADARIDDALATIAAAGGHAVYVRGDARDGEQVREAFATARTRYGRVNGAIHAALVLDRQPIAELADAAFDAVAEAKTRAAIAFGDALEHESLDFVLICSSLQSLVGLAGRAHYAAGCAFMDAYVRLLERRIKAPVRLINWGFWDVNGVTDESRARMAGQGMYFMTVPEGIECIERVLAADVVQVACLKADARAKALLGINAEHQLVRWPATQPASLAALAPAERPWDDAAVVERYRSAHLALESLSRLLLLRAFQRLGALLVSGERSEVGALRDRLGVDPRHERLYQSLLLILERGGYVTLGDAVTATIKIDATDTREALADPARVRDTLIARFPEIAAHIQLVWASVDGLPEIVTGRVKATDVLFPNASTALVEGIYRRTVITDYFNGVIGEAVAAYVASRVREHRGGRISILEVGAGTGGTTVSVLPHLAPFADHVSYVYSDISLALVLNGRKQFGEGRPFMQFQTFDVEKPVAGQKFEPGSFDIVIAANVLHATKDIRRTIRTVKALLKTRGWLALYEVTRVQDMMALTFGLLDGWWLFEDGPERLPGSPLLAMESWESLLAEEGFTPCLTYGKATVDADQRYQAVFVAESDGWRGRASAPPVAVPPVVRAGRAPRAPEGAVDAQVAACIRHVLQVSEDDFDLDVAFLELGVDSIMAVDLVNHLNRTLEMRLEVTDLFTCTTPRLLQAHVAERLGGASRPTAIAAPPPAAAADDTALLALLRRLGAGEATVDDIYTHLSGAPE